MTFLKVLLMSVCFLSQQVTAGELDKKYEARIQSLLNDLRFPGVAIAVVKNGKILYERGFGFRDLKNQLPVNEDTLFAIGSTSKAFTATSLGMIADKGSLRLDDPVRYHLSGFALSDPVASNNATIIDLLSHRTGLARHDWLWYHTNYTRVELLEKMRFLQSSNSFRDRFDYNNLMYLAAGMIVGKVGGYSTWESFVKKEIFQPLGMKRSNFSTENMIQDDNSALPYLLTEKGAFEKIPYKNIDSIGPAGSINSTIHEMANWLIFNISEGKFEGRRLLSKEVHRSIVSPRLVLPDNPLLNLVPEFKRSTYGLGWGQFLLRNREVVWHNGGIDGFIADVSYMPEEKIGIVVLANATHQMLPMIAAFITYDTLLDEAGINWQEKLYIETPDIPGLKEVDPPRPLTDYVGKYVHSIAEIRVRSIKDQLYMDLENFSTRLIYVSDGYFVSADRSIPKVGFQFHGQGHITLNIALESAVDPIDFKRLSTE